MGLASRRALLLVLTLSVVTIAGLNVRLVHGLPVSNQLKIPYHSQSASGAWNQNFFCGPASVEMTLEYISGQDVPQTTIASEMNTELSSKSQGTDTSNIYAPFYHRGYTNSTGVSAATLDDLKMLNAMGYVSIIGIWYDTTHQSRHFVVVTGYDESGIRINDPALTGSAGRSRDAFISNSLLEDLWATSFHHWLFIIPYPSHASGLVIPTFHGFQGSQIIGLSSSKPVKIDGKWTNVDEWSDASVSLMPVYSYSATRDVEGFVYVKHDNSSLYFLVDFVSALSIKGIDYASITIQPSHSGGQYPQSDDLRFDSKYPSGGFIARYSPASSGGEGAWKSTSTLPTGVVIAMSISDSPNQVQPHEITEFQIPFSVFPKMQDTVGFRVTAGYGNGSAYRAVVWPLGALPATPETWGELTIPHNVASQSTSTQTPMGATLGSIKLELFNKRSLTQIENLQMEIMGPIIKQSLNDKPQNDEALDQIR